MQPEVKFGSSVGHGLAMVAAGAVLLGVTLAVPLGVAVKTRQLQRVGGYISDAAVRDKYGALYARQKERLPHTRTSVVAALHLHDLILAPCAFRGSAKHAHRTRTRTRTCISRAAPWAGAASWSPSWRCS